MREVKIQQMVEYAGHSLSANGKVSFTLKANYSELTNTIQLMQMLNNDINIKARLPNEKPIQLGHFRIHQITVSSDGQSRIKLSSINDFVEMDNLNMLPTNGEDLKIFAVLYEAKIELEE